MKPVLKFSASILLTGIVAFTSCHKSPSSITPPPTKQPPVAHAGDDQIFSSSPDSIILDGSASTDPNGSILSYQWSRVSGPVSIAIVNGSAPVTKVKSVVQGIPVESGIYQFELKVTNASGQSSTDIVAIVVIGPPVVNAGQDQTIIVPISTATLSGNASSNLPVASYSWTKISGPLQGTITDSGAATTTVTNLVEGTYSFRLQVTTTYGSSTDDTVQVNVIRDLLIGQEFIFSNRIWETGDYWGNGNADVYVGTPDRPDLFNNPLYNPNRVMEVYLRLDPSATWITVPDANNSYFYDNNSSVVHIFSISADSLLVGTNASIKIKFH